MAEFPAMPLWTDAYLGDTTHLSTLEHGTYLLLLIAMWRTKDKSLPNDDALLARYAKLRTADWKRVKPVIMPFFTVVEAVGKTGSTCVVQGRLRDEATAVARHSTKQSGRAKSRWLKNNDTVDAAGEPRDSRGSAVAEPRDSHGINPASIRQCRGNANPYPYPKENNNALDPNSRYQRGRASDGDPKDLPFDPPDRSAEQSRFAEFWAVYPRKEGQTKAEAEFVKATIDADADAVIAGAKAFAATASRSRQETRFLPMPVKWLADKRWTDVHQEPADEDDRLKAWGIGPARPVETSALGMAITKDGETEQPSPADPAEEECPWIEEPFEAINREGEHAQPVRTVARTGDRPAETLTGEADLSRVQRDAKGTASEDPLPVGHDDLERDRDPLPSLRSRRGGSL